jgi:hypothetical protein
MLVASLLALVLAWLVFRALSRGGRGASPLQELTGIEGGAP